MGNRLSKIYTRTGDKGETGLGDGTRVAKDSLRVTAYGTVDELNSVIGVVIAADPTHEVAPYLSAIQHRLFDVGSELCVPGYTALSEDDVKWLERVLDYFNSGLPYLQEFILPAGNMAAAQCHVARTTCRRAERKVVALSHYEQAGQFAQAFLNRLSDLLFVLARVYARSGDSGEVMWQSGLTLPEPPEAKGEQ